MMDLKGVVMMKNMDLQKDHFLNYSQFYLNNQKVKNLSKPYHETLQNRLKVFEDMIMNAFRNIFDFLNVSFNNHLHVRQEWDKYALIEDIIYEYNNYRQHGIELINQMVNQLHEKEIDQSTYDLLNQIISYQEDITRGILKKELTLERIQVVFDHIKEVPYYLKSDLEIEELPRRKSTKNPILKQYLNEKFEGLMSYDLIETPYVVCLEKT